MKCLRLFEAIVEANQRAFAGDSAAGIKRAEHEESLPIIALTCIDPRLNPLLPNSLGLAEEDFIWLRNAGNIITGPLSSTMRSLALACALKGGKEIAILGHTDCRVPQATVGELIDRLRALGIERASLPDNLNEFFGLFASERQNVLKAVDAVRHSPLIGLKIPVHGLLIDTRSGRLDWLVNGYEALLAATTDRLAPPQSSVLPLPPLGRDLASQRPALKFPTEKIGEYTLDPQKWLSQLELVVPPPEPPPAPVKSSLPKPPVLPQARVPGKPGKP